MRGGAFVFWGTTNKGGHGDLALFSGSVGLERFQRSSTLRERAGPCRERIQVPARCWRTRMAV